MLTSGPFQYCRFRVDEGEGDADDDDAAVAPRRAIAFDAGSDGAAGVGRRSYLAIHCASVCRCAVSSDASAAAAIDARGDGNDDFDATRDHDDACDDGGDGRADGGDVNEGGH